jgi:YjbR
MTEAQFRKLALAQEGAVELSHMNHPDFRVGGKIFATIGPDGTWGMVKLTPEQQANFITAAPDVFAPAAGAWGRGGSTIVTFKTARIAGVRIAMEQARRNLAR